MLIKLANAKKHAPLSPYQNICPFVYVSKKTFVPMSYTYVPLFLCLKNMSFCL